MYVMCAMCCNVSKRLVSSNESYGSQGRLSLMAAKGGLRNGPRTAANGGAVGRLQSRRDDKQQCSQTRQGLKGRPDNNASKLGERVDIVGSLQCMAAACKT